MSALSTSSSPPPLLSIREAASLLGCSRATLYRLLGRRTLEAKKLGKRTLLTRTSVDRLIADLPAADIRTGHKREG